MKRRELLKVGATGAIASLPAFTSYGHDSKNNTIENSTGGYLKFRLGKLELLVVTDGHVLISPAQPIIAPGIAKERVKAAMEDSFMLSDSVDAAINILVIRKGKKIIIIDTGSGAALGDQAGKFLENLMATGIRPEEVTDIFITHLHVDHIGGILDAAGQQVFQQANYHLSQLEYDFWMSADPDFSKSKDTGSHTESIALARKVIAAIQDKIQLFTIGETLFGCLKTALAAGHTPGHPTLTIFSEDQEMTHIVDTAHTSLLLLHPEWGTEWDTNFEEGVATRQRILQEQAKSKELTMSCHLPWPGLGYIVQKDEGFDWVPLSFSTPQLYG
ncbi:MBL fold metallo-hydrolase [Sphingobacterium sp. SRCM116780]|uniref:MBL fold metallo-hydrolase n=1 Tax=Sphingobacterium sp. SRCM116780 TaxID=2907623 RepID=UPI001F19EE97|nr:MBL fold metallo-hydrolase [Sphingobacterium sp. SRCM116780]UIR57312.1 MBL fold metallo-hydrolase [Sphingobacterium sp. SRCM116780]